MAEISTAGNCWDPTKSFMNTKFEEERKTSLYFKFLQIKVREQKKEKKKPWWRRRLEWDVNELQKDLGRVKTLIEKKTIKKKHRDEL